MRLVSLLDGARPPLDTGAAPRLTWVVGGLPRGTVTFLFSDVEGSSRLLHELGAERYAEALVEHRRVLREAFGRHGGVEVDTQGDSFFVAFPTAPGAVAAAAEGQASSRMPILPGDVRDRAERMTTLTNRRNTALLVIDVQNEAVAGLTNGMQSSRISPALSRERGAKASQSSGFSTAPSTLCGEPRSGDRPGIDCGRGRAAR